LRAAFAILISTKAGLYITLAKRIAGERWQRKCKRGIFGFMNKPALNIGDLSPEERLRLIEELWDSLNETPGTVPLTNAQREELDRRLDDLEHSGPEGIPWDQVLQQIRSRSR